MRNIALSLILYLIILSLTLLVCVAQEGENEIDIKGSRQAFIFGKQHYNTGKYADAKELFSKAINMDLNNVEAYYYRALSANKDGTLQKDISFYTLRLNTNKDDYRIHFGLACSYLILSETFEGKKEDARKELNNVIALDKNGPFRNKAVELAEQYKIKLTTPPFNIMDHKWIFAVIGGIVLLLIIILATIIRKSVATFSGSIIITNPQGQIMLNNKLDSLPKKDKKRLTIGSGNFNDIILAGGNVENVHAELIPIKFNKKDRIRIIPLQMSKISRETGDKTEQVYEDLLWDNDTYKIGDYKLNYSNPLIGPRPSGSIMGAGDIAFPTPVPKSNILPSPSVATTSPVPPSQTGSGGTTLPSPPPSSSEDGFSF